MSAVTAADHRPAYLVKGPDSSLVAQATHTLVEQLVAGGDPSMMVEEFGGPGVDQFDIGAVIDACTTPPFLVDRRVVVVREAGQIGAADAKRLVGYLADPLVTTALVLVSGGGVLSQTLAKAVGGTGEVVDTSVGTGKARSQWLSDHLKGGPVRLDGQAHSRLAEHLGSDMGRLAGFMERAAIFAFANFVVCATSLRQRQIRRQCGVSIQTTQTAAAFQVSLGEFDG